MSVNRGEPLVIHKVELVGDQTSVRKHKSPEAVSLAVLFFFSFQTLKNDMIVYIIRLTGFDNSGPHPGYWKPYLKSFGSFLETTSNPAFAKIWTKRETAQRNADKAEEYLKNLHYSNPNIKATVLEVEFNIIEP